MAAMQMCKPAQVACDQTKNPKIVQNNEKKHHLFHFWHKQGNENANCQQQIHKQQHEPGHPKINKDHKNVTGRTAYNKPQHEAGHGQAANKHQHEVGHPKHNVHHGQAANNKQQYESVSHPRSDKLRQCFGHGARLGSDFDETETETVVIERKIKERVVISHVKKFHDHKEAGGAKHLDRC